MTNNNLNIFNVLRIISSIMLVIALAQNPYGYYSFLRIIVCGTGAYGALVSYQNNNFWFYIFMGIAILFNPIVPIYLDRETWAVIDIMTAFLFVASILLNRKD
jgi:hypothetical protein